MLPPWSFRAIRCYGTFVGAWELQLPCLARYSTFLVQVPFRRHSWRISTIPPAYHAIHKTKTTLSIPSELVGQSGQRYRIERLIQGRETPWSCIYIATAKSQIFVLKSVQQSDFEYYQNMYRSLRNSPNLRTACDTIPEQSMFVYRYFSDDFLSLVQKELPLTLTKRILRDALRGLASLHDRNIVHADVKANNIMIERKGDHDAIVVKEIELADVESAAVVPPGANIHGEVGNWMWCSPETHAGGPINKPSDMFSFGIVCIYGVLKRVIFAVGEEELEEGVERLSIVLERHLSYFGDADGLNAFLKHLGDSPWCEIFSVLWNGFNEENPRTPFSLWQSVDPDFRDLIGGLTNFDQAKRLTAHEALAHTWFADI